MPSKGNGDDPRGDDPRTDDQPADGQRTAEATSSGGSDGEGTPSGAASEASAGETPARPQKRVVKKIVKKVPVATRAAPATGQPGTGQQGTGQSGTGQQASGRRPTEERAAVPLAKDRDLDALPPPPDSAPGERATTDVRRLPPPPAVASGDEVRRVGPLQRRRLGRLRARKVRRILRHVEVWSVLKVSIVFYFCLWLVLLVSGALVWKVAAQAGLIDNVENFLQESGFDEVEIDGETMFRAWASGGFVMVFASTGFTVLMALLFNLISDLMGGVRFTVIELETIRRRKPDRGRRGGSSRPANRPSDRRGPGGGTRSGSRPGGP